MCPYTHTMKAYRGVEVEVNSFLTSALDALIFFLLLM